MDKPTLPKGTRDFGPQQMARRQFILNSIRKVFEKYGFQPLETPAMENLSTLTGKYGEEGDQLLFKVLNSGDFLKDTNLNSGDWKEVSPQIAEKGLKYDLTVPFARYVVMNRHEIAFPFKRYQIQPVWRADRPQKGRYREFVQCDADVIGTESILCEAEIVLMIKEVFTALNIRDYSIRINHRGILSGIAGLIQAGKNEGSLFVAIDKLDKTGEAKVKEELAAKGFTDKNISLLFEILNFSGSLSEKIVFLTSKLAGQPAGTKGLEDIRRLFTMLEAYGNTAKEVEFDFTLARGLSYYTGCIFEVKINNVAIGSVSGGGRYDNLTGVFGMPDVSGVGISFGVDRLYDALEELQLFPEEAQVSSRVLICHLDEACLYYGMKTVNDLRQKGIAAEVYPDLAKLKKQLEYADRKKIPFALVIGSDEMESGKLTLKNLKTGEQHQLSLQEVISKI